MWQMVKYLGVSRTWARGSQAELGFTLPVPDQARWHIYLGPIWIEAKTRPYQNFSNFNRKRASLD